MLEWAAAALGLGFTLATLGFFAWEATRGDDTPPALEVAVERIVTTSAGYLVEVEIRNRSGTAAAAVGIDGTLTLPGESPASSNLTVDFIPAHSARHAGLHFKADPRAGRLELRVLGYVEP